MCKMLFASISTFETLPKHAPPRWVSPCHYYGSRPRPCIDQDVRPERLSKAAMEDRDHWHCHAGWAMVSERPCPVPSPVPTILPNAAWPERPQPHQG